jgi:hypothetical protein
MIFVAWVTTNHNFGCLSLKSNVGMGSTPGDPRQEAHATVDDKNVVVGLVDAHVVVDVGQPKRF